MAIDVNRSSRLLFGELLTVNGVDFWDTVVLPLTAPRGDDLTYRVKGNDRIDLLAQRFYQNPVLWWVIAWANNMEILPTDLKEGADIRIPSLNFVENQLLKSVRDRVRKGR